MPYPADKVIRPLNNWGLDIKRPYFLPIWAETIHISVVQNWLTILPYEIGISIAKNHMHKHL